MAHFKERNEVEEAHTIQISCQVAKLHLSMHILCTLLYIRYKCVCMGFFSLAHQYNQKPR